MKRSSIFVGIMLLALVKDASAQAERDRCATPNLPAGALIEACTSAIASGHWGQSELAWAFNNRGNAHFALGNFASAVNDYTQAIGLRPRYPIALVNRGFAHLRLGSSTQAIGDFNRALEISPDDPTALNARCFGLARFGRPKQALGDCKRSLELRPDDAKFLDSLGYAYLRAGKLGEATASYTAALKVEPRLAVALFGRGVAREMSKDAGGIEDLQAARALDPAIDAEMAGLGVQPVSTARGETTKLSGAGGLPSLRR